MLIGQKLGMLRYFKEDGSAVPVTAIELGPNTVYQVKTPERDGYSALQVGFGSQKAQRLTKALRGHLAAAKKGFPQHIAEVKLEGDAAKKEYSVGDDLLVAELFAPGMRVDVVGTTIGRGFAGVVKRHKMAGFSRTHGTHEYRRHGGSIGCRKFPGRVFKNKRMAGHLGVDRMMQQNLEVVAVDGNEHILLVKGSIPGPRRGLVIVRPTRRA
jgi:large subunit ribosomal protein L3